MREAIQCSDMPPIHSNGWCHQELTGKRQKLVVYLDILNFIIIILRKKNTGKATKTQQGKKCIDHYGMRGPPYR